MQDSDTSIRRTRSYFATIYTIYAKEVKGFLGTPFGWVILACTMGLQGFWLQTVIEIMRNATDEGVMFHILNNILFWFYFIVIFPLITMRSFAEEERLGTLEGLLTAPVTTAQIVIGKFFAIYTFYLLLWAPMLLYPWLSEMANLYTQVVDGANATGTLVYRVADWFGPYSILALSGLFFIALGLLCSALTRSQIIAGVICTCAMISFYFLGRVTELWGEFPAAPVFHYLSIMEHVSAFSRGLMDTRPLVFYLSGTIFLLALTRRVVDFRRWRR